VSEPDPLLDRAASFLRAVPEPGWDAISARVLAAVHAAPRVGWPLRAAARGANEHGAVYVSDHVLRSILARELRRRYLCQPTKITFTLDGTALQAVDIEVTGSYGTQLRELGDEIRRTVFAIVSEVLEDPGNVDGAAPRPIDVTITDIVTGDPLFP
jgi:hypothetical protein